MRQVNTQSRNFFKLCSLDTKRRDGKTSISPLSRKECGAKTLVCLLLRQKQPLLTVLRTLSRSVVNADDFRWHGLMAFDHLSCDNKLFDATL